MIRATGVMYRSICRNSSFFMNFKIEDNELFCLWNTERILSHRIT